MVSLVDKSFLLSLSKALGCKRVHDDRIAGVTYEGNASRNALIVNKEYAWVGNPFSAPEKNQRRGELSGSPLLFLLQSAGMRAFPFSGLRVRGPCPILNPYEADVCFPCAIRRCCAAIPVAAGPAGASPENDRRLPGTLSRPGRQPSGPP